MSAESSKDTDFPRLSDASPKYYWLCRNSSESEFITSGDLTQIQVVEVPELDGSGSQNKTEVTNNLLF